MNDVKITVKGFKCNRCGNQWIPRFPDRKPPISCPNPKCRSIYWNKPRTRVRHKQKKGQSIKKITRELNPKRQAIREELRDEGIIK